MMLLFFFYIKCKDFPRDVLDEILNLIESVSEGFPTYSYILQNHSRRKKFVLQCHETQRYRQIFYGNFLIIVIGYVKL